MKELWNKYPGVRDVILIVSLMIFVRSSFINWYVIPSGSMLPTIKLNDHVVVNKLAFGLMLPFTDFQMLSWSKPKRGDIILFKSLSEDITLVKRAIGIGGDKVAFENGTLKINDIKMIETEGADRAILSDMGESADKKTMYAEEGNGIKTHLILRTTLGGATNSEVREFVVPADQIFVMGDNRDASNDSRFWGFVDVNRVYGKSMFVLYSTIPDTGFPPSFRTDRFFMPMQ